jgi:glycerate kinase
MSDGGDGFGEIIGGMMGAEPIEVDTIDAAHRPRRATFWLHPPSAKAIVEAAQVNGLALLPPGQFHPFSLDTFGLGKVYATALEMGAQEIVIGIGGSATNDGGFGFARAIGYQFLDAADKPILKWTNLERLQRIAMTAELPVVRTVVGVDVQNPLLGPNGASRIYGPQKGLRTQDMRFAERSLRRLADVVQELRQLGVDQIADVMPSRRRLPNLAETAGAGAAGGLGFGLLAFLEAQFAPGFDIFSEAARLADRMNTADVVVSGEGAIDAQTLMGKGVGSLYQLCKINGVRFVGLAGGMSEHVREQFREDADLTLMSIVPTITTLENAKAEPARYLTLLASEAAKKVASA